MPAEGKALSTAPSQIRKRLQRARGEERLKRDIELYLTHVAEKPLEQWDLEELARGRPRNAAGGFTYGPRMRVLDEPIKAEIARRLKDASLLTIRGHIPQAIRTVARLLDSEDEKVAFQAAKFIIEYTVGLPQQNVTVEGEVSLQNMLAAALVLPGGEDAHPVIRPGTILEGEVLADDDEESDDDDDNL